MQATKPRKYYVPQGISGEEGGASAQWGKETLPHPPQKGLRSHAYSVKRCNAGTCPIIGVCVENNLLVGVSEGSLSLPRLRN